MRYQPKRIRVNWRKKGAKKPENTVPVCRPYKFRNQFDVRKHGRSEAVRLFREWFFAPEWADLRQEAIAELKGRDLACWCHPHEECHADILLDFVNAEVTS